MVYYIHNFVLHFMDFDNMKQSRYFDIVIIFDKDNTLIILVADILEKYFHRLINLLNCFNHIRYEK